MIWFLKKLLERQFVRFLIIGTMNTAIDWSVLNILLLVTRTTSITSYALFKSFSFSLAIINSFFFNKHWTFEQKTSGYSDKEILKFVLINIGGLIINSGIATLMTGLCGVGLGRGDLQFLLCANVGVIVATGVSFLWNFFGYKFFVFNNR